VGIHRHSLLRAGFHPREHVKVIGNFYTKNLSLKAQAAITALISVLGEPRPNSQDSEATGHLEASPWHDEALWLMPFNGLAKPQLAQRH